MSTDKIEITMGKFSVVPIFKSTEPKEGYEAVYYPKTKDCYYYPKYMLEEMAFIRVDNGNGTCSHYLPPGSYINITTQFYHEQ